MARKPSATAVEAVTGLERQLASIKSIHPEINPVTARPYGITAEQRLVLIKAIEAGNFYSTACQLAGVSYTTFQNWMKRGGDPDLADDDDPVPVEPYLSFAADIREAEAKHESGLLAKIAASPDWKAQAHILDRRHGSRWSDKKTGVQVQAAGEVRIVLPDNQRSAE